MSHFGDGVRVGPADATRATSSSIPAGREDLGAVMATADSVPYSQNFGQPVAAEANSILNAATGTGDIPLNGAAVSDGQVTADVPRVTTLSSTANNSGITVTVRGFDKYGQALSEQSAGPNANTITLSKAFAIWTQVETDGAITTDLSAGWGDGLGLDYRLGGNGRLVSFVEDGSQAGAPTFVDGLALDQTPSATNGDVRGTYTPSTAPDGSKRYNVTILANAETSEKLFGLDQFSDL